MAIQQGAKYLEMAHGGHGVLLGGVPGVDPGTVVIIGAGSWAPMLPKWPVVWVPRSIFWT